MNDTPPPAEADMLIETREGATAILTMRYPERRNALAVPMRRSLAEAFERLEGERAVRAIILTGAGSVFSSGGDISGMDITDLAAGRARFRLTHRLVKAIITSAKPVIAAVNGMACGGAFYILGEVEFIIAADHATFFDPHVTFGMTAAFEPLHMAGRMPFGDIMRLSLLGSHERLSAKRAHEIGLVSEVVPADGLRDAADWCASAIAAAPPLARAAGWRRSRCRSAARRPPHQSGGKARGARR